MAQLKNTTISGTLSTTGTATLPSAILNNDGYFQSKHFRGEGGLSTLNHAMEPGYAGHDRWDFYEYGGIFNFHICQNTTAENSAIIFGINNGNLTMSGTTITSNGIAATMPTTAGKLVIDTQLPKFTDKTIDYAS